jgi:prolyl-tRNA synthetase
MLQKVLTNRPLGYGLLFKRNVHFLRSSLLIPQQIKTKSDKEAINSKSISCQIMERNGFISDTGTGFLTYLPLGKRVLNKVTHIVRDEMNKIQAQEIEMPALCDLSLWSLTGRDELMGSELFRLKDRHNRELCLCPTHEELVTSLVSKFSHILPSECLSDKHALKLYQITRKYRDESRPKHALLRAREFLMKDMYSFHLTPECVDKTYDEVGKAYESFFSRLNLNFKKVTADVGSMGGIRSHEYHVESSVGEDKVFSCSHCGDSISNDLVQTGAEAKDKIKQEHLCLKNKSCSNKLDDKELKKHVAHQKCIEIGHTFVLGDRYTKCFPINLKNMKENESVIMACYGIGRLKLNF